MKRLVVTALSAITLMGSFGATAVYAQPGDNNQYNHDNDGRDHNNRGSDNRNNGDQNRWDDHQHNGYTYQGRWHYGPPPSNVRTGYQPGFHQWRRGDRLPSYYRTHYRTVDYRQEHLQPPRRGYHYVRDDQGNTLLVAVATGVVLSAILNNNH
jgi:Ni/Co efflux regulator RcnB